MKYIREEAYAYIHGHEVGGTNPSLLEALASTELNLLLNVSFNKEVGRKSALYWEKNDLHELIDKSELEDIVLNGFSVIDKHYTWDKIVSDYETCLRGTL